MALNTWWDDDPDQRYWMEIATGDMGEVLRAPKFAGSSWSYELVSQVRPGDRVLHWRSGRGRGLVGWSEVTGAPEVVPKYTWQPRGTAGRALSGPRTTEGWVARLGGLRPFPRPIGAEVVQRLRDEILAVDAALQAQHGKPTYFPFYLYGGTQLRAQQGYLVRFPTELFDVVPGLNDARISSIVDLDEVVEDVHPPKKRAARGTVTRTQDPALRAQIERRSLDVAKAYYLALGADEDDIEEVGKPFDLRVQLDGVERHVEVKGSSMLVSTVELTVNEVEHGQGYPACDLIVIDGIEWKRRADGSVIAWGGNRRVWMNWVPDDKDLAPRKYAYDLPSQSC